MVCEEELCASTVGVAVTLFLWHTISLAHYLWLQGSAGTKPPCETWMGPLVPGWSTFTSPLAPRAGCSLWHGQWPQLSEPPPDTTNNGSQRRQSPQTLEDTACKPKAHTHLELVNGKTPLTESYEHSMMINCLNKTW